jgi:hypothetical protein
VADSTDTTATSTRGPDTYPGTPRWVKLAGIVVLLLVLLFGGLHLAGRGFGPGLHTPPASGR